MLPIEGKRNVLITSALPYVNNVPHLGNIIGSGLSADVFARYCRSRGYQVLFVSGADEYGTATEMRALEEGCSPKALCDKYYPEHDNIYKWFGLSFDHFGRTATTHQTEISQAIFLRVNSNGFTSTSSLKQLYCPTCNKFLADRFVRGVCPQCSFDDARGDQCDKCGKLLDAIQLIEPKCQSQNCGTSPIVRESRHIFLDLNRIAPELERFVEAQMDAKGSHWSDSAVAITRSWLRHNDDGTTTLQPRCITRDLQWGTRVPLDEFASKVFYVWFDAPIGYLSITKELLGTDWERWWKNPDNVELFHFLGKDNVAFHSIIFPATQLATGEQWTMVRHVCATEYLQYEDQKFSKSRHVGVFANDAEKTGISADVWRFYLIYMRPEGQDTSFCWDDFLLKVNSELLANFGNFASRAFTFLANSFGNVQPEIGELKPVDLELITAVNVDLAKFIEFMENVCLRDGLKQVLAISRLGNGYMQSSEPWRLIKGSDGERIRAATVIALMTNLMVLLGAMLQPFMPGVSRRVREFCNIADELVLPTRFQRFLKAGHVHNKPSPLIKRLDPDDIAKWKQEFGSKQTKQNPQSKKDFGGVADQLIAGVQRKFEIAKKMFAEKHCARLDAENAYFRKEIDQLKIQLGYEK